MESSQYLHLISQLKINTAKRNFFFKICLGSKNLEMVNLLLQKGLIRRFYKLHKMGFEKHLYLIYPNYTRLINTNQRLVLFARNADHITLTTHALRLLAKGCGSSNFVLKTDKGLLTHQEALRLNTGGILICFIY